MDIREVQMWCSSVEQAMQPWFSGVEEIDEGKKHLLPLWSSKGSEQGFGRPVYL